MWRPLLAGAWRLVGTHFRWIAGAATLVGVAIALLSQRQALVHFDWRLAPASFVGAIALFALAPFVQAFSFWLALRFIAVPARIEEAVLLWMRSFLLRYAPSGALAIVIRIRERARLQASSEEIWAVTGYENLAALCAGAFVAVGAFAAAGAWPPLARSRSPQLRSRWPSPLVQRSSAGSARGSSSGGASRCRRSSADGCCSSSSR